MDRRSSVRELTARSRSRRPRGLANAVVAVDRHGAVIYANPRVEATFGWAPAELLGEPVERLVPERVTERHRGQRDGFATQRSGRPMGIGLDLAGRRRDG